MKNQNKIFTLYPMIYSIVIEILKWDESCCKSDRNSFIPICLFKEEGEKKSQPTKW